MMKRFMSDPGFFSPRDVLAPVLCAAACLSVTGTLPVFFRSEAQSTVSRRMLTFEERVAYQRAIEEVYWRHRTWPRERPDSKPPLDSVMSQAQLEKKVQDYLRDSQAREDHWQRPITGEQLQAEMDRIAKNTKQPDVLRELFAALENDPFVIAECLARPILAERLVTQLRPHEQRFAAELEQPYLATAGAQMSMTMAAANTNYALPTIVHDALDTCNLPWTPTSLADVSAARDGHTAVWTGAEMIVWGGYYNGAIDLNTGARYNPSTDSWATTSVIGTPAARHSHTAVWTGTEMIVWGGYSENSSYLSTGGKYNPGTDSWVATSTTNSPIARYRHTAVWTGSEMIVWGGQGSGPTVFNTGGRYNPSTNNWTASSTVNVPTARALHTAVWTGSEMIVWGGYDPGSYLNTGGRYNPTTNTWTATATTGAPIGRDAHTAVWTGNEVIVWGGYNAGNLLNTGGRYHPNTDSWTPTSTTNAPEARENHTVVWTGNEMIVWGVNYKGANVKSNGAR
jgi:N-acetylneuraminic acid mutarotase